MEISIDKNLKTVVKGILDRIHNDWDIVIAVAGEEGSGKSTIAILLGYLIDQKFSLESSVAYLPTHQEIEEKFMALGKHQVFVVDEAIKAMYKMRFMDKLQTRINEMYATERWQNKVTILCIPRFTDLNEYFRNHRVKFWIQVVDRGQAVAFVKDDINIFGADPWHLKNNEKIVQNVVRRKKYVEISEQQKINTYKKSQNFYFNFNFPKLPKKIEERYKLLKTDYRTVNVDREKSLRHTIILSLQETGMKQSEIAKHLKCSDAYVSQVLKDQKPL